MPFFLPEMVVSAILRAGNAQSNHPPLLHTFFPAGFCVLHTFFPYGVLVCVHWCTFFPYGVFVHLSFSIAEGSPPRGSAAQGPLRGAAGAGHRLCLMLAVASPSMERGCWDSPPPA